MNTQKQLENEVARLTKICQQLKDYQRKVIDYRDILDMINQDISDSLDNHNSQRVNELRKTKKIIGQFIG